GNGKVPEYVALPEVKPYSGKDKGYPFKAFREAFELKYPRENWTDAELCALFKAKLTGKAKSQFETLPKHKSKSYRDSGDRRAAKTEEERKSVADFCVELDRLTRIAYAELRGSSINAMRAHLLYEQLADWEESYHLLAAMEGDLKRVYDNLKESAMRIERRHLTIRNVREQGGTTEKRGFPRRSQQERPPKSGSDPLTSGSQGKRPEKHCEGREQPIVKSSEEQCRSPRRGKVCYKCGEGGHVAKRCAQSSREPRNVASDKAKNGVLSLSARIKPTRCAMTMTENRSTKEQAVSPKTVGEVLVFGRKWTALLDTGSKISIMPVNFLQRALDDGFDIDHLERPLDHAQKVYDASGNRMQFIAAVEVRVVESGDKDGKVNAFMHVAENAADTIILGNNVLSSLGYKLMREGAISAIREVDLAMMTFL
uniref:CCHC-type domain-containing protein n=1 Tax=Heligmosomoides polygyrus TaxID=6339 RepID=A0A183GFI1_HELPZ